MKRSYIYIDENGDPHYTPRHLFSYQDTDIFMSIGGRGIGKTYGTRRACINDFLTKGEEFIYLRRTKAELQSIDKFFDDDVDFPEKEFSVTKKRFWIKDKGSNEKPKVLGYPMSLQAMKSAKGSNYPKVGTVFFDEFLVDDRDKVAQRYLPAEVQRFCDFYESIARNRPVRIVFCSNAISQNNPYFKQWRLKAYPNKITRCKVGSLGLRITIEMCDSKEFIEKKKQTRSGRLMAACDMWDSSVENSFLLDDPGKLRNCPKTASFWMNLVIDGEYYGVYQDLDNHIYFTKYGNPTSPRSYCCKKKDIDEKVMYARSVSSNGDLQTLKSLVHFGFYHFQNMDVKYAIEEFLEITGIAK